MCFDAFACVLVRSHTNNAYEYMYMSIKRTHFLAHSQYVRTAMLEMSDGKLNVSILLLNRTVQYSTAQLSMTQYVFIAILRTS